MLYIILACLCVLAGTGYIIKAQSFGTAPSGERLVRIKAAHNYRDGAFQNQHHTPVQAEDANFVKILWQFIKGVDGASPTSALPTANPNYALAAQHPDKPIITWYGHSTYLIQYGGKNIIIDPVFREKASPFSWVGSAPFKGTEAFGLDNLPPIDYVLLSHDHYDHLGYNTITALLNKASKSKVSQIYTLLGVGSHLEKWGSPTSQITELNWFDSTYITPDIKLTAAPARHFSGRLFKRGNTLWGSFILQLGNYKIYLGADSGYDTHFVDVGAKYGPFNLALLECGQYNRAWPYIHMQPAETVQAAKDLKADVLMPVHWAKFALALHPWQEPADRVVVAAKTASVPLITPMLGQTFMVADSTDFIKMQNRWWVGLK